MDKLTKLNLGAGAEKKEGYLNVDWTSLTNPDVQLDLNVFPYPFADNSFELVEAFHVLEHLDRPFAVMKEIRRILKPGGRLHIKVPHFSRGFTHSEHAHGFDVTFPHYFNKRFLRWGYFGVDFDLEKMELHWMAFFHLMPHMGYGPVVISSLKAVNSIVSLAANLSPALCSRIWCYWVGGFEEIEFVFIKPLGP
jgi:SAM-dependent methyltransferase